MTLPFSPSLIAKVARRREISRPMTPIASAVRTAGWFVRFYIEELNEAFLKQADPRAVQGGQDFEGASEWANAKRALTQITLQIEELEQEAGGVAIPAGEAPAERVWLREVDAGADNACWIVCARHDAGAVAFVPEG